MHRTATGGAVLESPCLRAVIDADGQLVSLVPTLTGREYIAPGDSGNRLELFRDEPGQWDAWDVDGTYRSMAIEATGPTTIEILGETIVIHREIGATPVDQVVGLSPDGAALDIETRVDWRAPRRLLKLAFDLDVHAERSSSEIQFGHIDRPTHANTSWDAARFEISGHRWVRVADATAGVTIANDRVYGRDISRRTRPDGGTTTTVRESLLRAPTFPDPAADLGTHTFRHSIRPGSLEEGIAEGYRLNLPLRRLARGDVSPLVRLTAAGAVIETIKAAADGSGDVIVRMFETRGGRARGRLEAGFPVARSVRVDLLEREISEPGGPGTEFELSFRAFEIVTVRLTPVTPRPGLEGLE